MARIADADFSSDLVNGSCRLSKKLCSALHLPRSEVSQRRCADLGRKQARKLTVG